MLNAKENRHHDNANKHQEQTDANYGRNVCVCVENEPQLWLNCYFKYHLI